MRHSSGATAEQCYNSDIPSYNIFIGQTFRFCLNLFKKLKLEINMDPTKDSRSYFQINREKIKIEKNHMKFESCF